MKKYVQAWQEDGEYCEIDGELVRITHSNGWTTIQYKEEDGSIWENHFPDWNLRMVRISHLKDKIDD